MNTSLYKISILIGSFLLFLIQPIVAKSIMPYFGSSISVWLTCLLFFQIALVFGYLYGSFLNRKTILIVHLILVICALILFKFPDESFDYSFDNSSPYFVVFKTLALSIGFVFLILSCNSTLVQNLYVNKFKTNDKSVYKLYSISNIGSLVALLSFPFVIDYFFDLQLQKDIFKFLLYTYAAIIFYLVITNFKNFTNTGKKITNIISSKFKLSDRLKVILFAALPTAYLVAITNYINLDVISLPLFWVAPLSLYLITFIIAFSKYSDYCYERSLNAQMVFTTFVIFVFLLSLDTNFRSFTIFIHLFLFFFASLYCHIKLFKLKPDESKLGSYYFLLSLGGAIGGFVCTIVAPLVFNKLYEYFIIICLVCFLRPILQHKKNHIYFGLFFACVSLSITYMLFSGELSKIMKPDSLFSSDSIKNIDRIKLFIILISIFASISFLYKKPLAFGAYVSILFVLISSNNYIGNIIFSERNFFGTITVSKDDKNEIITLKHGTTVHGTQFLDEKKRGLATTYFTILQRILFDKIKNEPVGVLGLGSGTISALGKAGQVIDYYEIDPDIIKIAKDDRFFTYLKDTKANVNIIYGDGRIKLREAEDRKYKALIIDAYSSDAIPPHLITKEAIAEFIAKISDDGILLMHVSNRFYSLSYIINPIAIDLGLQAKIAFFKSQDEGSFPSLWIAITKNKEAMDKLTSGDKEWKGIECRSPKIWTDNYYNYLDLIFSRDNCIDDLKAD